MSQEPIPSTSTDPSLDEILENDDRLRCIFSESIVRVENRSAVDRVVQEVTPVAYCIDLSEKLNRYATGFSQSVVREEFLRDTATAGRNLTSLETNIIDHMSIDLMPSIPNEHVKKWQRIVLDSTSVNIPMIQTPQLPHYDKMFSTLFSIQFEQLEADRALVGERLDIEKTKQVMNAFAKRKVSGFARDPQRENLNIKIVTALMLAMIRTKTRRNLEQYLQQRTILDDELTGGMFIRLDQTNTSQETTSSMIRPDAVGIELKVTYNLSLDQIKNLITYLFTSEPTAKMEAKIHLLASTKSEIRNDLVVDPERVFEHAIREHFMSRTEVADLIFNHLDRQTRTRTYRCPHCLLTVSGIQKSLIPHRYCKVSKWLVEKLGFVYSNSQLSIPSLTYVTPGITRYAKESYGLRTRLQTEPFFGKNTQEFVAYTIDEKGQPRKVAHQGIKTVNVNQPSTSRR